MTIVLAYAQRCKQEHCCDHYTCSSKHSVSSRPNCSDVRPIHTKSLCFPQCLIALAEAYDLQLYREETVCLSQAGTGKPHVTP
jgi:hypothetical protein